MHDCVGDKFIINGNVYPVSDFDEQILQSNQAVYEVIRIEEGIALFIEDYLSRLERTIHLSGLKISVDQQNIRQQIHQLILINNIKQGPLKLMISAEQVIVYFMRPYLPEPHEYLTGVKTVTVNAERRNPNAKVWNPVFREKIINTLNQYSAYEAILVDQLGDITEGSRSNVFFVRGSELFTAPTAAVLPGITRLKVLEVCNSEGIKVNEITLHLADIGSYESVFITGTSRKVLPVRQIDQHIFKVNNPLVGKISKKFEDLVADYIASHPGVHN